MAAAATISGCGLGSSKSGDPSKRNNDINESHFYVLLFPDERPHQDTSGRTQEVERAAIASIPELSDATFAMYVDDTEILFSTSDLSLVPNGGDLEKYVNNLNVEIKKWGTSSDWRSAQLELQEPVESFPVRAKLTLIDHRGRVAEFRYQINDSISATPLGVEVSNRTR